jgi:hypothetical protein
MLFSGFAFGRIISDTSWDVSPVNFIVIATIAVAFWIAFFTRLVWLRKAYTFTTRSCRNRHGPEGACETFEAADCWVRDMA